MSLQPENNPVPSAIDEEHEELHVTLQSLREMVTKSDRDRDALQDLVRELTEQVTRHFEHEEQGGYFEVALKRAPRLAEQARDLCRQHEDLSERVLSLNALASAGAESNGWWERIESDSLEFIARMFEHESAEKALLQRAYVEDLGAGD